MGMQAQTEENIAELKESMHSFEFPVSNKNDMVADVFRIHLSEQILELSNEFCKYYIASGIDDGPKYFAIVYESGFLPPVKTIDYLSKNHIPGLNRVLAYSIVNITSSNSRSLAVIVDSYDTQATLANIVKNQGILSSTQLEKMLRGFTQLMAVLNKGKIFGYNIKPSNVIMKDDGSYFLREFIDSYPFFYQEDQFLAPELLECHKAGRASYTLEPDIYSLGVTAFFAATGKEPWAAYKDIADYNTTRLEYTSYKCLLARVKMPERFRLLFRQLLHDNASVRWKLLNIIEWLDGSTTKNIPYESIGYTKNMIGFNDHNYSNMKSIAYALYNNWEKATKFIKDDKLYKWAGRLEISKDTLDGIKSVLGYKSNSDGLNINNKISKLLSILDPHGGVRVEGLGFAPKAAPALLHYLMSNNKRVSAELISHIMKGAPWEAYNLVESIGYLDKREGQICKSLSGIVRPSSPARGLERLVYSLNPEAKCLSKLLEGRYVTTIPELLLELDALAEKDPQKFFVDRHIVAFIASRLDFREEIQSTILSNFPKFADHPAIKSLSLFSVLQMHEPEVKIPNICNVLVAELQELFKDKLHSAEFKKEIMNSLDEVKKEGDLSKVISALSNQQQFINDYNGYYEACLQVKALEDKIRTLSGNGGAFSSALILGQKMTVLTSYILCFIVTITVII